MPCGHAAELSELREAALGQMPLGVELMLERKFLRPRRGVRDRRDGAFVSDGLAQGIAVIGRAGHDDLGGQTGDRALGLGRIALLAGGQGEADRAAQAVRRDDGRSARKAH